MPKGESQDFHSKNEIHQCCGLLPARIDLHKGHYVPNSRSWGEGVSVREALIFVDLESEKLFHSA